MKPLKLSLLTILLFTLMLTGTFCISDEAILTSETIVFNTKTIDNEHADYPFLVYEDMIYYPMTNELARAFGITKEVLEDGTLSLTYNGYKMPFKPALNAENELDSTVSVQLYNDPVIVNGRTISNEEELYPLIEYKDMAYFPLDWTYSSIEFGWRVVDFGKLGFHVNTQGLFPHVPTSTKKHIETGLTVPNEGEYSGDVYIDLHSNRYRDGNGDMQYNNGHFYSGDFIMEKRQGIGHYYWPSSAEYFGTWVDDVRTGFGCQYNADGSLYLGGFSNEQYKGFGVLKKADGTQLIGLWEGVNFIQEADLLSPKHFRFKKSRPGSIIFMPQPIVEADYQRVYYALNEEGPWFLYVDDDQKTGDLFLDTLYDFQIDGFEPNQTVYFKSIAYVGDLVSAEGTINSATTSSQEDRILVENDSEITSSFIMGDFKGFKKDNVYYLTNGEIWQQTSNDLLMSAAMMPHVSIKQENDKFILSLDNCIIDIEVERIEE